MHILLLVVHFLSSLYVSLQLKYIDSNKSNRFIIIQVKLQNFHLELNCLQQVNDSNSFSRQFPRSKQINSFIGTGITCAHRLSVPQLL